MWLGIKGKRSCFAQDVVTFAPIVLWVVVIMSLASDNLERIRQQVSDHLDKAEQIQRSEQQTQALMDSIAQKLKQEDAVLVAHYYTAPEVQALAEQTGGFVSDSLEMARFGRDHPATTLVVAGVKFMGETAKILTPNKRVLMPTLEATCSLDIGCPIDQFDAFCNQHPDRTVVVYANTSRQCNEHNSDVHDRRHDSPSGCRCDGHDS